MASVLSPARAVKTDRKPLSPVQVVGRFAEGVTPDQLLHGSAILEVADAKGEAFYWTQTVHGLDRRILGVWFQKFADGRRCYVHLDHLDREPSCTCEDAAYRGERPGGCRHVNAARQALVELARRLAVKE
ncbi:MAG TPA: hypothetical protein VKA46_29680 [Gemmataceae bacterium]|nr:hypothetical protein [Gemmataceae bacterium]